MESIEQSIKVKQKLRLLQQDNIEALLRMAKKVIDGDGTIYLCGNGGSAADAQHIAAECPGKRIIALTTNTSTLTAIGNDQNFESIFSLQAWALCEEKDLLIAISTTGHSANVLEAVTAAKKKGAKTVGLTGNKHKGGELAKMVDLAVIVPSDDVARVQECHMLIGHILTDYLNAEP